MKLFKNFVLLSFTNLLSFCSFGQTIEISKIEYASFDVNSYRTPAKNKVFIAVYSEIDSNGIVRINRDYDYKNKNTYFSYQLSATELKKLSSFFNSSKQLKKSVK